MVRGTKTRLACLSLAVLVGCQSSAGTGTLVGAGVGAGAGALIDSGSPWRGALIGAAVGAIVGYAIGNEIDKNAQEAEHEAATQNRVVTRDVTDDENQKYYRVTSTPQSSASPGGQPSTPRRVQTTVTQWNPQTQRWDIVSDSTRTVQ